MSDKVYEAKSVDEALRAAAEDLGVAQEDLRHEVLEEGKSDFWGFGESTVRVKAWVEEEEPEPEPEPQPEAAPVEAEAPPAEPEPRSEEPRPHAEEPQPTGEPQRTAEEPQPRPEPEEATEEPQPRAVAKPTEPSEEGPRPSAHTVEEVEDLPRAVAGLLNRVFHAMDFDCRAEARLYEEQLHVAISGEDNQYLLEGRGRGLSALELLLNHGFRHRDAAEGTKIRVDAGDFKSQQEDEIRDLAYQVAHQAKETGEPQETRSLNPYERRIVHLTLADDPKVTTRSQGDGFMKVVRVIPE